MSVPSDSQVEHFDLIVIGTGSGNTIPDENFADYKVAIVEKGTFGGTCINVGCIPTKMFVLAADLAREIRQSNRLSINATYAGVDWEDLQRRVFTERIDPISAAGEDYRRGTETPNVTFFPGQASFIPTADGQRPVLEITRTLNAADAASSASPVTSTNGASESSTLSTTQTTQTAPSTPTTPHRTRITGTHIVLATGTRPRIPQIITDSGVPFYTNETIMRAPQLPQRLLIWGGGVIATEFAHIFSSLGSHVTIVNRSPLLRKLDATVTERFNNLARDMWDVRTDVEVTGASHQRGEITLQLDDGTAVSGDALLLAVGRENNSDTLNLAAAGVEVDSHGTIRVDQWGRTTTPGVWALGDASNNFQLKHVANSEARTVSHNIRHPEAMRPLNHHHVPSGVFTYPQIATVGMTQQEAERWALDQPDVSHAYQRIRVKVQEYADVAYGWALEETTGFCKLIADAHTGRLLGAHIMGQQATTLLQELVTVMAFGLDVRAAASQQYWPHPALSEVVENALLGLDIPSSIPLREAGD